jgi:excisionase family DNA binding protein
VPAGVIAGWWSRRAAREGPLSAAVAGRLAAGALTTSQLHRNGPIGLWRAVGSVYIIIVLVLHAAGRPPAPWRSPLSPLVAGRTPGPLRTQSSLPGPPHERGCAVAAQPSGKAAPDLPRYLHTAEVADLLHVSPKTVSRWAKEGKLPFLKTLGGHRRYPAAEIRQLAEELRVRPA